MFLSRGRKVYRRFDDEDDEEEEIDSDDLGLLEQSPETNVKTLKPLTRRSIKPKRLFQTEAQKKAREVQAEEEALTDIEDSASQTAEVEESSPVSPSLETGRSLRSNGKTRLFSSGVELNDTDTHPTTTTNKTSPFDTWPRMKSGGGSATGPQKGRKRAAGDALGDSATVGPIESKKTRT